MSTAGPHILVIEDESEIRRFLRVSLTGRDYRLTEAENAAQGLLAATSQPPDLIVLDLGLPDMDGLDLIHRIRQWSRVPIVVLSARGQEKDKIAALDGGADDYLTKPFGLGELLARIRVGLRNATRAGGADEAVFGFRQLRVDLAARRVTRDGAIVHLTPTEYRLLTTLIRYAGKVVTHRQLLREVWGPDSSYETHYLRVYMGQLRQKIEVDPARPQCLLTEPGVGYRLATE